MAAKRRITRSTFLRSSVMLAGAAALNACDLRMPTTSTQSAATLPVDQAQTPTPASMQGAGATGSEDRAYWLAILMKIANPILNNLAQGTLKANMPVEANAGKKQERAAFTHLEAVGRLLAGMAPWLELEGLSGTEEALRQRMVILARGAIKAITDPKSPDSVNFRAGNQIVVDTAYLAHALLRAPNSLWAALEPTTQQDVVNAFKTSRMFKPYYNNWIVFSAMTETLLYKANEAYDPMRIDYALRQLEEWYAGDGFYSDGPQFHWDYYNSYVMHPMLIDILGWVAGLDSAYTNMQKRELDRAQRYAVIQEHLISPEGTYPPIGRSITYRYGAFQLLAQMALQHKLPPSLKPAQVRAGMNAVIRKVSEAPGMFDANGWLTIGLYGHQPGLSEDYISTGSLYMCTLGLLPLGLPPEDEFWSAPALDWSARRIWSGQDEQADHYL